MLRRAEHVGHQTDAPTLLATSLKVSVLAMLNMRNASRYSVWPSSVWESTDSPAQRSERASRCRFVSYTTYIDSRNHRYVSSSHVY